MNKFKALIISDRFFLPRIFEEAVEGLSFWSSVKRRYLEVAWPDADFQRTECICEYIPYPEETLSLVAECEILVTQMGAVDARLLEHAHNLRVVGCLRSGPVNVDVAECTKRRIPLFCVAHRSGPAVAEFTLGLMIAARRGIAYEQSTHRKGRWNQCDYFHFQNSPLILSQERVGLVGFGKVARALVELLRAFRCEIWACDPAVEEQEMRKHGVKKRTLQELLSGCDIVSLHVRLTPSTRGMIGKKEIACMKKEALLINTARGGLVDEKALAHALEEGRIAGAALDTLEDEPWSGVHPLAELPNVVLTPHIAGAAQATAQTGAHEVARLISEYCTGFPSRDSCVNPEVIR